MRLFNCLIALHTYKILFFVGISISWAKIRKTQICEPGNFNFAADTTFDAFNRKWTFLTKLCTITFQVHCAFLDVSSKWNTTGMDVVTNKLKKDPVECRSDHLSSFTMVMLKAEVYGNSNKNIKN